MSTMGPPSCVGSLEQAARRGLRACIPGTMNPGEGGLPWHACGAAGGGCGPDVCVLLCSHSVVLKVQHLHHRDLFAEFVLSLTG